MLTVRNSGAVFGSMVGWKMVMRLATALNCVRSARLAFHANTSDVTTAANVPAAAIAAMVCWCVLKNSSIIVLTHPRSGITARRPGRAVCGMQYIISRAQEHVFAPRRFSAKTTQVRGLALRESRPHGGNYRFLSIQCDCNCDHFHRLPFSVGTLHGSGGLWRTGWRRT